MKIMKITPLALALTLVAAPALADPVEGLWQSPTNSDGASLQLRIAACGAAFCGTIASVRNGDASVEGKRMVWDMAPKGGGSYTGGKVWAPDDDKTYRGKLELTGNRLKVSGCVLGGAVCRGETFTRIK